MARSFISSPFTKNWIIGRSDCCTATPTVSSADIGTFCINAVPLVCGDSVMNPCMVSLFEVDPKSINKSQNDKNDNRKQCFKYTHTHHHHFLHLNSCKRQHSFVSPHQTWLRKRIARAPFPRAIPNTRHPVLCWRLLMLNHFLIPNIYKQALRISRDEEW